MTKAGYSVRIVFLAATACLLAVGLPAQQEEEKKITPPIEVTQEFITSVVAKDAKIIGNTFSFQKAYEHFTQVTESTGIDNPWTLEQLKETLLYYFRERPRISQAKELQKSGCRFDEKVNEELGLALVVITEYNKNDKVVGTTRVKLQLLDKKWQIVEFPNFYPLDAWEILTGGL